MWTIWNKQRDEDPTYIERFPKFIVELVEALFENDTTTEHQRNFSFENERRDK